MAYCSGDAAVVFITIIEVVTGGFTSTITRRLARAAASALVWAGVGACVGKGAVDFGMMLGVAVGVRNGPLWRWHGHQRGLRDTGRRAVRDLPASPCMVAASCTENVLVEML